MTVQQSTIRVRLFAAAKAAVGVGEVAVAVAVAGRTIADALEVVAAEASDPAAARRVFARSSFLVDGVATTEPSASLDQAATLDVLPPFAGG